MSRSVLQRSTLIVLVLGAIGVAPRLAAAQTTSNSSREPQRLVCNRAKGTWPSGATRLTLGQIDSTAVESSKHYASSLLGHHSLWVSWADASRKALATTSGPGCWNCSKG